MLLLLLLTGQLLPPRQCLCPGTCILPSLCLGLTLHYLQVILHNRRQFFTNNHLWFSSQDMFNISQYMFTISQWLDTRIHKCLARGHSLFQCMVALVGSSKHFPKVPTWSSLSNILFHMVELLPFPRPTLMALSTAISSSHTWASPSTILSIKDLDKLSRTPPGYQLQVCHISNRGQVVQFPIMVDQLYLKE